MGLKKMLDGDNNPDILVSFMRLMETHGADETALCSGVLDLVQTHWGERFCLVLKGSGMGLSKICERGLIESNGIHWEGDTAAARVRASGNAEFEASPQTISVDDQRISFDGLWHVPLKAQGGAVGVLSLAASKKEIKDELFCETLASLGHLLGIALYHRQEQESASEKESRLKAALESIQKELDKTNGKLIDRVKELKPLYVELENRIQELTKANQAKDEFLSIVSHELRTPLTSLTGFISVLLDEEAGAITDQQRKFLSIAKQSAQRLNAIISDLLDISRMASGRLSLDMQNCSLKEIVDKSVQAHKKAAQAKGINLMTESMRPTSIWGDESRLIQVLENLISNAIKFTDRGGAIEVFSEDKGDFMRVAVRDNGPGLSAEDKEKLFQAFSQADTSSSRSAGGAGLGLAIARGIVEMHGGQVFVESEKGKGATFSFMIPKSKAQKVA